VAAHADDGRWVGYPYTKAMCSNWDLDLGAAVVVCSVAAAEAAGVPRDRWVFLHAGAEGSDTPAVSNRWSLATSPALELAGRRTLELAGVGPGDLAHVDLYSCFPVAVEVAAQALGLDEERDLTVTGGLCFAGGPLNNYVTHSIAAMLGVLREDAGSTGLVTANGGYLTKHAMGVYSTEPPREGFRWEDVQPAIDKLPTRDLAESWDGEATIEALTVMHGRDGAERGIVGCLLDDGRRTWAATTDPSSMAALMAEEHVGRRTSVAPGNVLHLG
jgi:acetyl-CoA C-acetyltransferase